MSGEHVAMAPRRQLGPWGEVETVARCSCGWVAEKRTRWNGRDDAASSFELHREDALKPAENACRYCAVPIPWGRLFCADACKKAASKRPDDDAVAEVLGRHREDEEPEVIVPSPDQGALW